MQVRQDAVMDSTGSDVLRATCPSRSVLSRVVSKWSLLVVVVLQDGPVRFNQLHRTVGGVSAKVLVSTLRGLERDGLIWRRDLGGVPPHVEYGLTDRGVSLSGPVSVLQERAQQHAQEVLYPRDAFDRGVQPEAGAGVG